MAKVLLVEDDNNLREIYQARLTAEGYDIVAAQNGEDALVLAKQHHPDLVISDVMMPRISGYEMLDILRNTDELKHTKVIMLTALGQNEDKERAGKLGADKYLVKSQVTLEDIVNSAKALLADDSVGTPQAATPDPSDPLGMSSATDSSQPLQAPATVSAVAAPIAPPSEDSTSDATATEPTVVAPAPESLTPTVPEATVQAEPSNQNLASDTNASAASESQIIQPSSSPSVTDSNTTTENETPAQPAPPSAPVSVDDLINGNPEAAEAVASVAQEEIASELSAANQSSGSESAPQNDFLHASSAPTVAEPPTSASEQNTLPNDAVLNDAMQSLTSDTTTPAPEPSAGVSAPAAESEEAESAEPHQIEGLSGVTEVVEVPDEVHVDPTPSTTATVIQPVVTQPETAPTASPVAPAPNPAMTQTVTPTELPPAPVEQPEQQENDGVNVVGKKVIQPLSDLNAKPDLDKLLAQEEAKQSGEVLPQPTVGGAAPQPAPTIAPKPPTGPDPNNIAL